jgi:hypothetical protein
MQRPRARALAARHELGETRHGSGISLERGIVAAAAARSSVDLGSPASLPGVYAAGNLLRAVESSGLCAIEGARAGSAAATFLASRFDWKDSAVPVGLGPDCLYLVPQRWDFGALGPGLAASLRVNADGDKQCRVAVRQGGNIFWRGRPQKLLRQRHVPIDLTGLSTLSDTTGPIMVEAIGS